MAACGTDSHGCGTVLEFFRRLRRNNGKWSSGKKMATVSETGLSRRRARQVVGRFFSVFVWCVVVVHFHPLHYFCQLPSSVAISACRLLSSGAVFYSRLVWNFQRGNSTALRRGSQ